MTLLNETYELTDIFQDYVENRRSCFAYANCDNVKNVIINFCIRKMENYVSSSKDGDLNSSAKKRLAIMKKDLNLALEDFNVDGVNFCNDPNIGFMIAIMVTSTKYPEEEPRVAGICNGYGKLCYVYNYSAPDFSELGYCFFKQDRNYNIIRQG